MVSLVQALLQFEREPPPEEPGLTYDGPLYPQIGVPLQQAGKPQQCSW